MGIVRTTLEVGKELTFEEQEAAKCRIKAASKRPYVYDPDCPLLTTEQLAEFRPVNYATMEERKKAMKEAGILDTEENKQAVELKMVVNK
jgi:DNA-binding transcriptional regulator YhcF (GntR family)